MACFALGLSACGKKPDADCAHSETAIIGEAKAATCTEDGISAGSKCLNCGEVLDAQVTIPATGHVPVETENYGHDATNHWIIKECSVCELEIDPEDSDKVAHSGGSATCEDKAICSICEQAYGDLGNHSYTVQGKDASNHWMECFVCEEVDQTTIATHEGGTATTCGNKALCVTCGEPHGEPLAHDFSGEDYTFDDTHHWKLCSRVGCGGEDTEHKIAHEGGTANCTTQKQCTVCSANYGEPLGHDFDNGDYITLNGEHWQICAREDCEIEDIANKEACSGGNASCTVLAQCADCGKDYGDLIAHDFAGGEVKKDELWHWKQCKNCTAEDEVNKEAHTGGVATCTETGKCIVCQTAYVNALGHDMKADWEKNDSKHWHKCLRDGCTYIENEASHYGGTATCLVQANCTLCGIAYGETENHDYDLTTYGYKDEDGHAHVCKTTGCEAHDTVIAHIPDIESATESAAKKCTECNYIIEQMIGHTHTTDTAWESNASGHWHPCTTCGAAATNVDAHVYTNDCDSICNTCSYERAVTHDYSEVKKSATEHWVVCSVCKLEQSGSKAGHWGGVATCTDKAECQTCAMAYGDALGHDFATSTTFAMSDTQHWKVCNREGCNAEDTSNKFAHGGEATCQSAAQCPDCKKVYGEQKSHNFADGPYLSDGTQHWKKCKDCDAVDATKSNHAGGTASCTTKARCLVCNVEYGNVLGHDYSASVYGSNSTQHWQKCARCGEADATKTNHSGGSATCGQQAKCSVCNTSYGSSLSHSFTKYKNDATYHWGVCERCGYENSDNKVAHNGTATCATKAVCTSCGVSHGSLKDHTYSSGWEYKGSDGHAKVCTVCKIIGSITAHTRSESRTYAIMERAVTCTQCSLVLVAKLPATTSYSDLPENTNPNLKYFGYFHGDGFEASTNNGTSLPYTDQIAEMGNSNMIIINYGWNANNNGNPGNYSTLERVQYIKSKGMKCMVQMRDYHNNTRYDDSPGSPIEVSGSTYRLYRMKLVDDWKAVFDRWYNALKDYIEDGTIYAFYFDEPWWHGWEEADFIKFTKYMREKSSKVRIMTCASPADIGAWTPSNLYMNGVRTYSYPMPSKAFHQYVTDVMYDEYGEWNDSQRATFLSSLKSISPDDAMIWGCVQTIGATNGDYYYTDLQKKSLYGFYNQAVNDHRYAGLIQYTYAGGDDAMGGENQTPGGRNYLIPGASHYNEDLRNLNINIGRKIIGNSIAVTKDVVASFDDWHNFGGYSSDDMIKDGWARDITTNQKHSGMRSIVITPSSNVAQWPAIKFRHNWNDKFNLSNASYISIWAKSNSGTISGYGLIAEDANGNKKTKQVSFGTGWTELKLTVSEIAAAGVNTSAVMFSFGDVTACRNKTVFYLDDLTIGYTTSSSTPSYSGCNHSGGTATCTAQAVCSKCGESYGTVKNHTYTTLKKDANYHWYACATCGAEQPNSKVAHSGAPSCTTQPTCSVCNQVYGSVSAHDFVNSTVYKSDGTNHWKKCANCNAEDTANKSAHAGGSATCLTKAKCLVCNAEHGNALGHDFANSILYTSDGTNHMKKCIRCEVGDTSTKAPHTGGANATCTEGKVCDFCNLIYQAPLGHDWDAESWNSDSTYHWNICKRCDAENTENKTKHDGGEVSCTVAKTCTVCMQTYGQAIGHDFDNGPTMSNLTYHWKKCANCTEEDTSNKEEHYGGTANCQSQALCEYCAKAYGSLGSHEWDYTTWDTNSVGHARKCKTVGCTVKDTRKVHTPDRDEPTETLPVKCIECNYVMMQVTGHTHEPKSTWSSDANSHWKNCVGDDGEKFSQAVHDWESDCDTICDTCNYERVANHDFENGSWVNINVEYHWKKCANCDAEQETVKDAHTYDNACDDTCNVCAHVRSVTHDFENGSWVNTNATHHWKKCGRSGCTAEDTLNKIAHVYTDSCDSICNDCNYDRGVSHDFAGSATYDSDGTYHWKLCENCGVADSTRSVHAYTNDCDSFCDGCNYDRQRTHEFASSTLWASDGTQHWKKCGRTGCTGEDTANKENHVGGNANCAQKAVCTTCQNAYGSVDSSNHAYSSAWSNENNQHYYLCNNGCGVKGSLADCAGGTATCTKRATCTTCQNAYGLVDSSNHAYASAWTASNNQHYHVCNNGCETKGSLANCSGGTATCTKPANCSTCNNAYGLVNSSNHAYPSTWTTSNGQHWKTCSNGCSVKDSLATCSGGTATLSQKAKCSVCNVGYGSVLSVRNFTVGTFDAQNVMYVSGLDGVEIWNWPRAIDTATKRSGTGSLKVTPHPTDGKWSSMSFLYNGKNTWDLSSAKTVSIYLKATTANIVWLEFSIRSADGSSIKYSVTNTITTSAWTELKIDVNAAKTANPSFDLSKAQIVLSVINEHAETTYDSQRYAFYVDDLIIGEGQSDTKWTQIGYSGGSYDSNDDWPSYMSGNEAWTNIARNWDAGGQYLGTTGIQVVPSAATTWSLINFKYNNSTVWDLTNVQYICLWVKMSDDSAQNSFYFSAENTKSGGVDILVQDDHDMAAGCGWSKFVLDIEAYRNANPTKDLTACKVLLVCDGSYTNTAPFFIDEFTVIRTA